MGEGLKELESCVHLKSRLFIAVSWQLNVSFSREGLIGTDSLRQTDFSIPRFNTVTYGQHS